MIIGPFSDRQLLLKVIEGKETVRSIEFFIVFPVAALDFPIVPRGVSFDQLVSDSKLRQSLLKDSWLRILPLAGILHLLIRLRRIFLWIRQFLCHGIPFPKEAIQTGNRACVSPCLELHPAVDILAVGVVTDCCLRNAVLLGELN